MNASRGYNLHRPIQDHCRERPYTGRTYRNPQYMGICFLYTLSVLLRLILYSQVQYPLTVTSGDLPVLAVFFHISHVDFFDLAFTVDIVLVNVPWRSAAKPAGRTILATAATIKRCPYDCFAFFTGRVFDQDGFHEFNISLSR